MLDPVVLRSHRVLLVQDGYPALRDVECMRATEPRIAIPLHAYANPRGELGRSGRRVVCRSESGFTVCSCLLLLEEFGASSGRSQPDGSGAAILGCCAAGVLADAGKVFVLVDVLRRATSKPRTVQLTLSATRLANFSLRGFLFILVVTL